MATDQGGSAPGAADRAQEALARVRELTPQLPELALSEIDDGSDAYDFARTFECAVLHPPPRFAKQPRRIRRRCIARLECIAVDSQRSKPGQRFAFDLPSLHTDALPYAFRENCAVDDEGRVWTSQFEFYDSAANLDGLAVIEYGAGVMRMRAYSEQEQEKTGGGGWNFHPVGS